MNKTLLVGILIAVAVAGGLYFYSTIKPGTETPAYSTSPSQTPVSGKGEVIFEVTDKAVDLKTVSEVELTASRMELYSATKGWVTVPSQPKTYKLLKLKSSGQLALAAKANVDAGVYSKVRFVIDKVVVKTKSGATQTARVPSGSFVVDSNVMVNGDATSSVKLDFLVDKSLHTAVSGEYVFAPVIEIEARKNTTASVDSQDIVTISDGSVTSDVTAGMDLDGSVKLNFQLDANAVIKLEGGVLRLNTSGSLNY